MKGHLTTDELIDRLYGLSVSEGSDRAHLTACTECRARWKAVEALRREMTAGEPVSAEFLAAQRRNIYSRLERPAPRRLGWLPALAAAGALAAVALVYRPPAPQVAHPDPGDAQLFTEVYSMEQSTEAMAAAPIHELFEDNSQ